MSSRYYSVSQYCVVESTHKVKPAVCDEIIQLFDEICSFNISYTAFPLPKPHTVSQDNCALLCADLDMAYVSRMLDSSIHKCTTLCKMDSEAVAVFLTLFQLKDFIAAFKLKEEQNETAINSTKQSQQSSSTSKAGVNALVPLEPNTKPTAAAVVNASTSKKPNVESTTAELITKKEWVATARTSTVQLQQSSSASEEKNPAQNVEPSTTGKSSVPSTKPDFKTATTASMRPSSTKATEKSTTATDTIVKKTTLQEKPAITAEGENDTTTKEAETTLIPVITEKKPTQNVEPSTTDKERKRVSSTKQVVKPTTAAQEEVPLDKTDSSDDFFNVNESEDIKEDDDELNKDDEILSVPEETPSKIEEKDETSRQDDTPSSYHFLIYFLAFIVMCVAAYIVFHNKHKIIAFIIEGKQGRRGGRPSTKQYTPLKSKVEDVMPFIEKSTTQSNYIY